jgi:hypothetical protein
MWILDCGRAIPFLGLHKWDFGCGCKRSIYIQTPLYFFNSEFVFKYAVVLVKDFSVGNDFDVRL